jgi:hypothetical protein
MMDTLGSWVSLNAGLPPTASDLGDGRRGILLVEHCRVLETELAAMKAT